LSRSHETTSVDGSKATSSLLPKAGSDLDGNKKAQPPPATGTCVGFDGAGLNAARWSNRAVNCLDAL
jgi:hypothetical protein